MCTQLDGVTSHKTALATASLSAVSELSQKQLHIILDRASFVVLLFIVFIYLFISICLAFVSLSGIFPRLSLIMP
jgi:hypothetical protein